MKIGTKGCAIEAIKESQGLERWKKSSCLLQTAKSITPFEKKNPNFSRPPKDAKKGPSLFLKSPDRAEKSQEDIRISHNLIKLKYKLRGLKERRMKK